MSARARTEDGGATGTRTGTPATGGTAGDSAPPGGMRRTRHTLHLTGSGPTRERAFAAAMAQVQHAVGERTTGVCFRVEPVDLEVVSAVEHRWTERFLGVLFPRRRAGYELTLRIEVRAAALDLDAVDFSVREERLSPLQHALHMR